LAGVLARGASKKAGTLLISATVETIATSNLVYNLGLRLSYQKQRLGPKLVGGLGQERIRKKIWDPLFISATVEASD